MAQKLGSCIESSKPFYDAFEEYKTAQERCQEAAVQREFGEQATFLFDYISNFVAYFLLVEGIHKADKETIAVAEHRSIISHQPELKFNNAWQEMLNQATVRVE